MKNWLMLLILVGSILSAQNKKVTSSEIFWKSYKSLKAESFAHFGTVILKAGDVTLNSKNEIIAGNFIMDMNTIVADDMKDDKNKDMLERHLKSDDFFNVKKFPTVFFKILSVKKSSDSKNNSIVTGNLTIKGITKKISFPANILVNGNSVSVITPIFKFNRRDFDLKYETFEDMLIAKEVEMRIKFTAQ